MCEIREGDEVVCVDAYVIMGACPAVDVGQTYVVARVYPIPTERLERSIWVGRGPAPTVAIFIPGDPVQWFRKVQKRDLQSWLNTSVPNTDHLDKPLPAKKRERVQ